MAKVCDNKCAGMLVRKGGRLLLVERKKYNFGFAPPAGHLDGLSPEKAAIKELKEEVGLKAEELNLNKVLEKDFQNPCRRDGGSHHLWFVYDVSKWEGSVVSSKDEVRQFVWVDDKNLRLLAKKLEDFAQKRGLIITDLPSIVRATNEDPGWQANPGLEPPWYVILKELRIV